jgi:nicotinamide-nucleotide adenylyltransferase
MSHPSAFSKKALIKRLYDIPALRQFAQQINAIRATAAPSIEIITPAATAAVGAPLLIIPGSYNPPTTAHQALIRASQQTIPQASLYLALGTTIINKEQIERATLLDRLLLIDQIARRNGQVGVFLINQGLYVEQARAARAAFPQASEIVFVVGFDKIEQIFDARYYEDRDAALKELFALASFLVAPRDSHKAADVAALLLRPGNELFQASVRALPFPANYRAVSSSQVRAAFQAYPVDLAASLLAPLLPPEALAFAIETGCYSPPEPTADGALIDRYGIRTALLARALALPEAEQATLDLQRLFQRATSATAKGQRLYHWLGQPEAASSPHDLLTF